MVYLNVLVYSPEFESRWACELQPVLDVHASEVDLERLSCANFADFDRYQHYELFLRPCSK